MNADRCAYAGEMQRRAMANIGVPKRIRRGCLPPQARLGTTAITHCDAVEPSLPQQLAHGTWFDRAVVEPTVSLQRADNESC